MKILLIGQQQDINFLNRFICTEKHEIETVVWNSFYGPEILNREKLEKYRYIFIAVRASETFADLLAKSIEIILDDASHVMNVYQYANAKIPKQRIDRVMQDPRKHNYDGMILGISHAEVGILEDRFGGGGKWCNAAVSGQDLYWNYITLKYCVEKYPHKIQDLKHIIIDMYEYNVFNIDNSSNAVGWNYFYWEGLSDPHNYFNNTKEVPAWEKIRRDVFENKLSGQFEENYSVFLECFSGIYEAENYEQWNRYKNLPYRLKCADCEKINFMKAGGALIKRFPDTIEENRNTAEKMLELIYRQWPKIRVSLILLPRYQFWQEKFANELAYWKPEFMEIIGQLEKKYPVEFYDFKYTAIAEKDYLFQDFGHLNYWGAYEFTKLLKKELHLDKEL